VQKADICPFRLSVAASLMRSSGGWMGTVWQRRCRSRSGSTGRRASGFRRYAATERRVSRRCTVALPESARRWGIVGAQSQSRGRQLRHSKCQCHAWTNGATRSQLLFRLFALAQKYRAAIGIKTGEEEEEEEVPLMDEEAAGAAGYMNVRAPLVHTHVRLACPSVAALVCCGRILMGVD